MNIFAIYMNILSLRFLKFVTEQLNLHARKSLSKINENVNSCIEQYPGQLYIMNQ